jgi:hypothetical protein
MFTQHSYQGRMIFSMHFVTRILTFMMCFLKVVCVLLIELCYATPGLLHFSHCLVLYEVN